MKLNGAVVLRSDYPRLVKFVIDNNLWSDEDDGLFGMQGDPIQMKVPNLVEKFTQFSNTDIGKTELPGLPNIEGKVSSSSGYGLWWGAQLEPASNRELYVPIDSALTLSNEAILGHTSDAAPLPTASSGVNNNTIRFNATRHNPIYGRSSTVQPPSVRLIPMIKY